MFYLDKEQTCICTAEKQTYSARSPMGAVVSGAERFIATDSVSEDVSSI